MPGNIFNLVIDSFRDPPPSAFHVVVAPYSLPPPEYLRESRHVDVYLPCVQVGGSGRAELQTQGSSITLPALDIRGRLSPVTMGAGSIYLAPPSVRGRVIPEYFAAGHVFFMSPFVSGRADGDVSGHYVIPGLTIEGRGGYRVGSYSVRGNCRLPVIDVRGKSYRSYRCAMTGLELIHWFREMSQDKVTPYLWEDDFILRCLNEAENEAADRAKLLFDDATPEVVDIDVTAGKARYNHHPRIVDIEKAFFVPKKGGPPVSLHQMDRLDTDWRDRPHWRGRRDLPYGFVHDGDRSVVLMPVPKVDGTLHLEVHRLPLMPFKETTEPEIPCIHHLSLVDWALFRAFSIPDADEANERLAAFYHDRFEKYFGRRIDARKRRTQRMNKPHVNKLW